MWYMDQLDNSCTPRDDVFGFLQIRQFILRKIVSQGKSLDMHRVCSPAKFDDLVDEIFYEKILKISKMPDEEALETALLSWIRIARGLDAQKCKSYLFTTITNAWRDIQKSAAQKMEEKTANLVDEIPAHSKEFASEMLVSHRDKKTIEPESARMFAACKLFFEFSREERMFISFTFIDELGLVDIGERMGISKSTVKRRHDALFERFQTLVKTDPALHILEPDFQKVWEFFRGLLDQERTHPNPDAFVAEVETFCQRLRTKGAAHEA